MTYSLFKNKKRFSKIVASTFLFATTTWVQAYQLQGFFSSGMGVTFDTPKQKRNENMIEDSMGLNANLNQLSEYHQKEAPSVRRQFSSRPNFHTTNKIGLQFYQNIGTKLSATTQFLAKGHDSDFDFVANWAFLSWNPKPDLTVRAGRVVIPLFLLSEYLEVGYAYPWVRPPLEMYAGSPLNRWSGLDISKTGYKGDWDYQLTFGAGTVNELVQVSGNVAQIFVTRNGLTFNSEFGTDILRLRLGISRVDILAEPGLSTVDSIVGGATSLYSGWAVNEFNDTVSGDGTIKSFNELTETHAIQLLGDYTSPQIDALTAVKAELYTAENQEFIAATLAAGLAGNISQGTYGESDPALPANIAQQFGRIVGALGIPAVFSNLTAFGANVVTAANNENDPSAQTTVETFKAILLGNGLNSTTAENTANAMLGVLTAFGASENPSRFNAIAQLYNLKDDQLDSSYGLLAQAIKGVVDQTYGLELKNYLYKTFNNTWRSASFLGLGFTYDDYDYYASGEYGFRRTPGYFGDNQGWYVTLGKRYGAFLPHLTFAASRMRDKHVRLVSSDIYQGDTTNLLSNNPANDWKNMLNNVRDGVSDAAASPVDYENLLFVVDQLGDFWDYNQGLSQDSISLGVKYDWRPGICLKTEVQHIRPKLGSRGHFDPWDRSKKDSGNVFMMTLDAVF
jgi:hypothetical protein